MTLSKQYKSLPLTLVSFLNLKVRAYYWRHYTLWIQVLEKSSWSYLRTASHSIRRLYESCQEEKNCKSCEPQQLPACQDSPSSAIVAFLSRGNQQLSNWTQGSLSSGEFISHLSIAGEAIGREENLLSLPVSQTNIISSCILNTYPSAQISVTLASHQEASFCNRWSLVQRLTTAASTAQPLPENQGKQKTRGKKECKSRRTRTFAVR